MTETTKKLSDVLDGEGTNLVYISGQFDGKQIDCDGPIEWTRKFDKPVYPIIPALPQYDPSKFKHPVFDYGLGAFVEKDENNQAKIIADLQNQNSQLQKENVALKSEIKDVQKGQIQTTTVLGQLMPAVQELVKFAKSIQDQEKDGEK